MSNSFRTLKNIEREAKDKDEAYELIIGLRSGRVLRGDAFPVEGTVSFKLVEHIDATKTSPAYNRITYVEYDAIETVTPVWL